MQKRLCMLIACLMFTTSTEVFAASKDNQNQMCSDDGKAVESVYYEIQLHTPYIPYMQLLCW